ncbi:potassium channel protein [Oculatella sp. LEGE 06141]|uniref:potassium channel family protein n=1 Tax=Oculatella sp. LEGE 06141 TaxID=1828648 RepID=UPI00187EDBE6|nr:potassium channel protein [Oculatella sp. LEGE 06141]MBE9177987.1 potassium channel protein [Oculatella sp. LEGE 06141]
MQSPIRRVLTGLVFFVTTLIIAVLGYTLFGWTLLDAIYMVVITVYGVGYGEVRPLDTPSLKIFTMLVIIAGTSSVVYAVGGFIQMVAEGEIDRALDHHRKSKEIESLRDHVIICGFGRIGQTLARKLVEARQPFVVIDSDGDRIALAGSMNYIVYNGDATDEETLEATGIEHAKVLATVLPDDATNVFITLTARGLNPKLVIVSRGELPSTENKLRLAGADHVVLPATISGLRMANLITHPNTIEFLDQDDERNRLNELLAKIDVQIDELVVPEASALVGATVGDLEVRGKGTFVVVALRQSNGKTVTHPSHSIVLRGGDIVIVLGHRGDIPQFVRQFEIRRQLRYRGAKS